MALDTILALGAIPVFAILIIFLIYPEKVEKWSALIARLFSFASTRAEKSAVARDIQGRIKEFRASLGSLAPEILPYGVRIRWVDTDHPEAHIEEDETVVVMKEHTNQAQNYVNAVLAYVPVSLLPRARTYVQSSMMHGIDLVMVRNMIIQERMDGLAIFERDILQPAFRIDEPLYTLCESLTNMDDKGLLTRIMLPTISEYGSKLWPSPAQPKDVEPVSRVFETLVKFATKPPGVDIGGPFVVITENLELCIVPVAKFSTVASYGTDPHMAYLKGEAQRGVKTFYVMSSAFNSPIAKVLIARLVGSTYFALVREETFQTRRQGGKEYYLGKLQLLKPIRPSTIL